MSRQLQARIDLLIIGDSNVERNLFHTGRLYCLQSESVPARNVAEFSEALKQIQLHRHKIVVFAMLANIVVNANSSSPSTELHSCLTAIEACLKKLVQTVT